MQCGFITLNYTYVSTLSEKGQTPNHLLVVGAADWVVYSDFSWWKRATRCPLGFLPLRTITLPTHVLQTVVSECAWETEEYDGQDDESSPHDNKLDDTVERQGQVQVRGDNV